MNNNVNKITKTRTMTMTMTMTMIKKYVAFLDTIKTYFCGLINSRCKYYKKSTLQVTSFKSSSSQSRPTLLQETKQTFNEIRISKVHLIWIPSHVNILSNELSDALAKLSLNMPNINSTNYLELSEAFSIIESHVINECQRNYDNDSKGRHYKCICREVNASIKFADIDRRKKVQISRLILGKVNLNERLLLMKS